MKNNLRKAVWIVISTLAILIIVAIAGNSNIGLKFSHKLHVTENEIECLTCHAAAENSTTGQDNLMPEMETCGNCHDIESQDNCSYCHSDPENPTAVPRVVDYSVLFSHEKHLSAGFECQSCHQDVVEKTKAAPYVLPKMADCMSCHEQKKVSTECRTCHLPSEKLVPRSHGPNFLHEHGNEARSIATASLTSQNCNLCHKTSFCQNCHEGDNLDRTTHPLNYEFTHSFDAISDEKKCTTCHTDRSFCIECHASRQVLPHDHTPGWANRIPGDGGRHRIAAQNDLEVCMSCHEQNAQLICQTCHSK